ncbi:hypothetical protein M406DRAFT_320792 [Cryphonectria parasitica EP155]|uniref:C2H2-type domain-containing protein n=1 Tax=Cryphonectria parasitica (strain ATCC 38755 / EP155) TaxID=660469 RepID=A0A9P4YEX8_CRYP1|nr:uncharacterized protein M406DRAFT_320792 [Cryphonectria parasitica EP155]KAF3771387.1 hypothetical protein M406DRAFT_320792 [Cryphonectria parasitica EP155]
MEGESNFLTEDLTQIGADPAEIDLILRQLEANDLQDDLPSDGNIEACDAPHHYDWGNNTQSSTSNSGSSTLSPLDSPQTSVMTSSPADQYYDFSLLNVFDTKLDGQLTFLDPLELDLSVESLPDYENLTLPGNEFFNPMAHPTKHLHVIESNEIVFDQKASTHPTEPQPSTKPTQSSLAPCEPPSAEAPFDCPYCHRSFADKTKFKIHTNKHTKPFRCSAACCDYAAAEKKSLQRHLLAKSKWDEEHRRAAQSQGVENIKHRCPKQGCTYSTIREDNLKRHMSKCTS